jgi:hypothetical protein
VRAIGVTAQWSGTVAVGGDGAPLHPALIWMDSRGAPDIDKITGSTFGLLPYGITRAARWITLTGGPLRATDDATGLMVGLYRVRSTRATGVAVSALQLRTYELRGIGVAGYTQVGRQRGISVAIYNDARALHGLQLGVLNRARNNPTWARWLPIVNAHF